MTATRAVFGLPSQSTAGSCTARMRKLRSPKSTLNIHCQTTAMATYDTTVGRKTTARSAFIPLSGWSRMRAAPNANAMLTGT
ncbi:MAG: hypothetical protein IPJ56_24245 [Gemmatimonadetes bacterium]|nr:hypothetical protein [Gemmatimonadota bacterium]